MSAALHAASLADNLVFNSWELRLCEHPCSPHYSTGTLFGCHCTVSATVQYANGWSSHAMSVYKYALGHQHLCHDHQSSWFIGSGCMQRYANKLGSCLLETSEDINSPANRQLAKWVSEVTSLMVCMAQGNPKVALKHGLADFTNTTHINPADPTHRQDAFFLDLVVSSLHLRLTPSRAMSSRTAPGNVSTRSHICKLGSEAMLVGHCRGSLSQHCTHQTPASLDICR